MSRENLEVIREGFRAFNAGSEDWINRLYAEDAVVQHPPGWPEPGPSVGREAISLQFARLRADMTRYRITEESVTGSGDRFVVKLRWTSRALPVVCPGSSK